MSDPQGFTAQQAADPSTPAQTLADIAAQRPDLRPALASNPATYEALLEWLAELGDPDVDAALAARGGGAPAAPVEPVAPVEPAPPVEPAAPVEPAQPGQGWQPITADEQRPVEPGAYQPGGYQPGPAEPGAYQPGPAEPGAYQPGPAEPGAYQPGPYQPGPAQPGAYQPGGYQPGPYQPGPAQPWQQPQAGQAQPGAWQPGGGQPGGQQWQAYGGPPPKKSRTGLIVVLVVVGVLIVLGIGAFVAVRALGDRIGEIGGQAAPSSFSATGDPQEPPPGDDPVLDALWLACQAEDWAACDRLYDESPIDSEYEAYGATCGYRTDGGRYCVAELGG